MGFEAAAVLYHIDEYRELLAKTRSTNALVNAVRLYINNPFILSCMKAFAFFNYKVTYPFYMFSLKATQSECKQLMPTIYDDLKHKKMDTLSEKPEYAVEYSFEVPEPTEEIEKLLLDKFCVGVAESLKTQKGREYGFDSSKKQRATNLALLSDEELNGLPPNNMICERQLGKVDYLLKRSANGSRKFEGYGESF
jgi:hypothetical protein